jgi:succinate dehydrogenase/fumarate reductase-like Fe-S protein
MGLKTTDYFIQNLNLTISTAYCKVTSIRIDKKGNVSCYAEIQQTREDVETLTPLQAINFNFITDKSVNVYEQAYTELKKSLDGWQDDIVLPPS